MTLDRHWVEERLARIERKREMLGMLEDSLLDWERELDSAQIPDDKQDSFRKLTDTSIETLETLIARLNTEIRDGLAEIVSLKLKGGR